MAAELLRTHFFAGFVRYGLLVHGGQFCTCQQQIKRVAPQLCIASGSLWGTDSNGAAVEVCSMLWHAMTQLYMRECFTNLFKSAAQGRSGSFKIGNL